MDIVPSTWLQSETNRPTFRYKYLPTDLSSARHVDLAVGSATDRPAYLPTCPHKKPKSPTESLKSSTPGSDFKSFPDRPAVREMGILSKPSARAAKIPNFVV